MPTDTALRLMNERGTMFCEVCNSAPGEEGHHCLYIKDNKNKKAKKLLDLTYNLQLVCHACHAGPAKTHENKVRFWNMQCKRYGREVMLKWHMDLPYKIKEREYY